MMAGRDISDEEMQALGDEADKSEGGRMSVMQENDKRDVRRIAVRLGRALALTIMAAQTNERMEDEAIAAMDRAWEHFADKFMDFAERND